MNKVNPFTWGYDEFDRFESIPNQFKKNTNSAIRPTGNFFIRVPIRREQG